MRSVRGPDRPGVGGQIHALAYDPDNLGHIYAGGDNCGVYRSEDNGLHWTLWNAGLNDADLRVTSYIEDLIVVPHRDGVPDHHEGVYAATRGGIAFRPTVGDAWQVQTSGPRFNYRSGLLAGIGGPIPYASLAFDPIANVLYAGAGDGRLQNFTSSNRYPETGAVDEYSLWKKDVGANGDGIWRPVELFGDKDAVFQIAILIHPDGTSNPVVASRQGLWLENPLGGDWQQILSEEAINQRYGPGRSGLTVGVGVGENGKIYGLARRAGDLDPGVYLCEATPSGGKYTYTSAPLELESDLVPPHDWTWEEIVHTSSTESDLRTLSVVPGDPGNALEDDEIFVGMTLGETYADGAHYNGYFRWALSTDGIARWANVLYRNEAWSSAFDINHTFSYVTEVLDGDTYVEHPINSDMGWLGAFAVGSTVAWQYQAYDVPDGPISLEFAALAHYPMGRGNLDNPAEWSQRYAERESGPVGVDGYYRSRGLNIMSGRALAFTPAGELVLGCGDLTAFVSSSGDGSGGFRWLDPYHPAKRDCRDLEAIEGPTGAEIYAIKGAPINWGSQTTQWFGYDTGVTTGTPPATVCRQRMVIARSVDNLDGMDGEHDGYRWAYCSYGFDSYMNAGYEVVDIEFMGSDILFAAVKGTSHIDDPEAGSSGPGRESMVFMGTRVGATDEWDWEVLWDSSSEEFTGFGIWGYGVRQLQVIPGTRRLLIATTHPQRTLLEYILPPENESTPPVQRVWVDRDADHWSAQYPADHRMTRSFKNVKELACDPDGWFLYVTSAGQESWYGSNNSDRRYCANVLRVPIPADGSVPAVGDWVALLNQETDSGKTNGIAYPMISSDFWPDGATDPTTDGLAEYMPLIESLDVHPDNPQRIFIGLRTLGFNATENFHRNNGVWEYRPEGTSGQWIQVKGGPMGEPCKGITTVGLVPGNTGILIAASWGQEFFRVDGIAPSSLPVSGVTALEAVHPEQDLLMVTLQPDDSSVADVWVDATAIGGNARLHLVDDGTGEDWVAGDGIWTASVAGFEVDSDDTVPLPVYVRDAEWNTFRGEVDVQVLAEVPTVYYRNDSDATGATFSGLPSGIAAVDLYETADAGIDADRDIYVSALADDIVGLDPGTILLHMGRIGDVPQYEDKSDDRFLSGERPTQNRGPATAADLNGDGLPDLIVPDGSSDDGLLLFEQTSGPKYVRRDPWLGDLPSALQADTWSAACGDYDGDGQLDIYLCRSTASEATGMPGPGSDTVADVLLRSDMANNKEFIDDTDALEVPLDGQGQPIHLATRAAAWCDFDGDGDLDLAIADGSTAKGVFIYRNDPDTGPTRFSIVYPTDPATAPWPHSVSGIAWVDVDGDGDLDLVATTHADLTSNACYVFLNQGLTAAGPFAEPQLLASIPPDHGCTGVRALDQDLDGDQDLLLLPGNANAAPLLLLNDGSGTFASATSAPGLGAMKGGTNGALVADLNGDGRAELFLGRPEATGRFFGTAVRQQGGSDHWIALDLRDERLSGGETVQIPAVGAKVVVQCGPSRQASMLVEANGRTDHVLRIGVETDYTPSYTVFWPSGHVTSHPDLVVNAINVLTAPTTVDLQLDSVAGFTELKPGEVVDWVFRWTTDVQVDMARSRIMFTEPLNCQLTVTEIAAGDPHVSVKQWAGQSGGSTVYFNELRWSDRPCTQCAQAFVLETGRGGVPATSDTETIRTRLCTTLDPNNPPGGE